MLFGSILIIIGVVFLLENLGILSGGVWDIIWPLLLILLGLSFFFKKHHWCYYGHFSKNEKKENS